MNPSVSSRPPWSTAFYLGPGFPIQWYGIIVAIGIAFGILMFVLKLIYFYKIQDNSFYFFIFIAVLTMVLGARAWYFLIEAVDGRSSGSNFFDFRNGGLAIQGGVLLTTLAGIIYFNVFLNMKTTKTKTTAKLLNNKNQIKTVYIERNISVFVMLDLIAPCVLIGQAIGRWGNFFNAEVYGAALVGSKNDTLSAANTTWGFLRILMPKVWDGMFINGSFRIPLFLIESFFNTIFFVFIYFVMDHIKGIRSGTIGFSYFLATGIVRLILETQRDEAFKYNTSIVFSALLILVGIVGIIYCQTLAIKLRGYFWTYFFLYGWYKVAAFFTTLFMKDRTQACSSKFAFYEKSLPEKERSFFQLKYYNDVLPPKIYRLYDHEMLMFDKLEAVPEA